MTAPRLDPRTGRPLLRTDNLAWRSTALMLALAAGWAGSLVLSIRSPSPWMPNSWALGLALLVTWQRGPWWGITARLICEAVRWLLQPPGDWNASMVLQAVLALAASLVLIVWVDRRRKAWQSEHELARLDPLTQLPNRQALQEQLEAELSRARRFHRPLSLFAIDCDGFKQINDQWGHAGGDEALRQLADALRKATRQYDTVARYGGDEFILLLPETDLPDAESVAERLQTALAHAVGRLYPGLTASLGVVVFREQPPDAATCLRLADETMYRAKHGGKNRAEFEVWEPVAGSEPPDHRRVERRAVVRPMEQPSPENVPRNSDADVAG